MYLNFIFLLSYMNTQAGVSFMCLSNLIFQRYFKLLFVFFLLEYHCFTVLCQSLLYTNINQLHGYIHSLILEPPSRTVQVITEPQAEPPVLYSSHLFCTWWCIYLNPALPIHPCVHTPLSDHNMLGKMQGIQRYGNYHSTLEDSHNVVGD